MDPFQTNHMTRFSLNVQKPCPWGIIYCLQAFFSNCKFTPKISPKISNFHAQYLMKLVTGFREKCITNWPEFIRSFRLLPLVHIGFIYSNINLLICITEVLMSHPNLSKVCENNVWILLYSAYMDYILVYFN